MLFAKSTVTALACVLLSASVHAVPGVMRRQSDSIASSTAVATATPAVDAVDLAPASSTASASDAVATDSASIDSSDDSADDSLSSTDTLSSFAASATSNSTDDAAFPSDDAQCAPQSVLTVHDTETQTVFVTMTAQAAFTAPPSVITSVVEETITSVQAVTQTLEEPVTETVTVTQNGRERVSKQTKTVTREEVITSTIVSTVTHTADSSAITSSSNNNSGSSSSDESSSSSSNNSGSSSSSKGSSTSNNNNGKGGSNNNGKDIVTVTQKIVHVLPTTKTVTKTLNDGSVKTVTDDVTLTSTEVQTVTAAPTETTITSTITHDQPVTVTQTVTENGQEVVKTTEVITDVVTLTSDVITQTSILTTTVTAFDSTSTDATSTSTADNSTSTDSSDSGSDNSDSGSSSNSTDTSGSGSSDNSTDPQTSLFLDPRNVMTGLFSDGDPTDGETATVTSTNNFINHCLLETVPITNGLQTKTGSCNPVPMGRILSTDRMPSSTFTFPPNFGTIQANTTFTIQMKIQNLVTGNFANAAENYYAAPAQVDETGTLKGHSHVVIERLEALDQITPTNPLVFEFFKGFNDAAVNGILTAEVTGGLSPGKFRIGSINSATNHQPALIGVAQHGTIDAYGYFTVE